MFAKKNHLATLLQFDCPLPDHFAGVEISADVNVKSGKAHKLFLDPATGIFRIKIGQARIPLVPLLKTMGVTDKQLRESWGDLAAVNQQKSDPQALKKLYERVRSTGTDTDPEAQSKSVAEAFQQMELDPDVTKRTLGQAFTRVGPDSILATTRKLLAVSRGEQEPDDRDSMAYQSLMGPEDLFAERIQKAKNIARSLLWKSTARRGIDHIPAGVLTNALQSTLTMSGLGQALEEINTAEILDHQSRVTRRGEGGIQDASAIPLESRSVNPSQLGLIDYLRTPESLSAGIDVRLARNTMKGSDGRLYTKVINAKSGLTEVKSANDIADGTLAFSGELQSGKLYVNVLQNGKIRTVPRENVDYELPDTESSFSPLGNMIPDTRLAIGEHWAITTTSGQAHSEELDAFHGTLRSPNRGFEGTVAIEKPLAKCHGKSETRELNRNLQFNGKSIAGESQIWIKRGATIWPTAIANYQWMRGDKTVSIDPNTRDSAWLPVTGHIRHANDKQLLTIKLRSGRSVTVTDDHSLMVLSETGDLEPALPHELDLGTTSLPIAFPSIDVVQGNESVDYGHLIGLYLASGNTPTARPNRIIIAAQDEIRQNKVSQLFRSLGGRPVDECGVRVVCTMPELARTFRNDFGRLSHEKRLPHWVYSKNRDFREAIIAGYFAEDGNLSVTANGVIHLCARSASSELRDGLSLLLSTLGVFVSTHKLPVSQVHTGWSDSFELRVIVRHIRQLSRWFLYDDLQQQLDDADRGNHMSARVESIPIPTENARELLYSEVDRNTAAVIGKSLSIRGAVSKKHIEDATGPYGEWARGDVLWDKVVSIVPAEHQEFVYDLSVATSECFAVNCGVVVHNSSSHQSK